MNLRSPDYEPGEITNFSIPPVFLNCFTLLWVQVVVPCAVLPAIYKLLVKPFFASSKQMEEESNLNLLFLLVQVTIALLTAGSVHPLLCTPPTFIAWCVMRDA